MRNFLRKVLKNNERYKRHFADKYYIPLEEAVAAVDHADKVLIKPLQNKPVVGIIRDSSLYGDRVKRLASWLRYERFLKNNGIPYGFYDIKASDWIRQAEKFDIIVWHTPSSPSMQNLAESKIYVLEKKLGKTCFPSIDEIWQYENKSRANYLYQVYDLPGIPTFTTNSYEEAKTYIEHCRFPLISKIDTAAGSSGVRKIDSKKEAERFIADVFLGIGKKTCWHYLRQKDYIYFQEFIDDATFDLRIFVVDNKAFGYYRYPNKGDFKASGADNYEKKALPEEALRIAVDAVKKLNSRLMSVDMLHSPRENKYYIIETSLFNRIDTPEQLVVDGVAGYYDISDMNNIRFKPGRFWLQELSLKVVVEQWARRQAEGQQVFVHKNKAE